MAEEKTKGNVVIERFRKEQEKKNKRRKWDGIDDALNAACQSYMGSYEPKEGEKTVNFEKALGDLIEVLQKIKSGDIKLKGLGGEGGITLPTQSEG